MSITDELREWKRKLNTRFTPEAVLTMRCEINCIADRIDKTLEDYIELPKDADGQTIHVGDVLDPPTDCPDFLPLQVMRLTFDGYESEWFIDSEDLSSMGPARGYISLSGWSHHRAQPDSWERIIRDAQGDGILNQIDGRPSDFDALVERCKRLAGENA